MRKLRRFRGQFVTFIMNVCLNKLLSSLTRFENEAGVNSDTVTRERKASRKGLIRRWKAASFVTAPVCRIV